MNNVKTFSNDKRHISMHRRLGVMRAALALPPIGKSISIAFALRACVRASEAVRARERERERERESPSVAKARQRNLWVRRRRPRPPGGGLN